MAFIIHLHLGSEQQTAERPAKRAGAGWWRHRWSSLREYEEHLHRTFGSLAERRGAAVCAAEEAPEDLAVIEVDDLCEVADETSSAT